MHWLRAEATFLSYVATLSGTLSCICLSFRARAPVQGMVLFVDQMRLHVQRVTLLPNAGRGVPQSFALKGIATNLLYIKSGLFLPVTGPA
jgi:hypothetical protein